MADQPNDKPIAQEAYDELAEAYAAQVDTKPHNAYYERPATLSLLPEVQGKRVLDAGCGPGVYAEWLADRGAQVMAIDVNENMVRLARQRLARQRLGDKVKVVHANLEQPLDFLEDSSFDLVVCPLVMDYLKEWEKVFSEFYRVLKAGGHLIFSIEHPYTKYADHQESSNYFEIERVEYTWRGFGEVVRMPSYRRPMQAVINPLIRCGFILEQILEPLPTHDFREKEPEEYAELSRKPGFMCVRAVKAH